MIARSWPVAVSISLSASSSVKGSTSPFASRRFFTNTIGSSRISLRRFAIEKIVRKHLCGSGLLLTENRMRPVGFFKSPDLFRG